MGPGYSVRPRTGLVHQRANGGQLIFRPSRECRQRLGAATSGGIRWQRRHDANGNATLLWQAPQKLPATMSVMRYAVAPREVLGKISGWQPSHPFQRACRWCENETSPSQVPPIEIEKLRSIVNRSG